eukprot:TCALIF_08493-PA protein Name:"Similar to ZNF84 Zinc finger protein 84 (Homo sapiens)" AED:0.00 eAED:0.00 QI:154/1/1/1/1/1/2/520/868
MSSSMLSQGGIGNGPYLESGSLPPPPMLRPPPLTRTSALGQPEPYQLDYGHSYDIPSGGGAGGSHEINPPHSQLTPLSLTQEHPHRHIGSHHPNGLPHHHHHHHHVSEHPGIDPYQDYYQTTTRGFNPSAYDHMPPLSSSQDPRTQYNSGYHDYSVGGKNGSEVDPYFYASTSTALTSSVIAHQPSNQYPRYLDEQSSSSLPPPTVAHPPPPPLVPGAPFHQHYQPSPAVLLHIRYVMESICEWMQFTDVSIMAGSSTFRAHRTILASHSTFLRQLLINNILDVGEGEEPCLILPGVSLNHMRLLMQFFYTGMVSLSGQEDIQPLKDVCCNLGISSLMARLEELSFSLQCLPNYQEPFKYTQPMASSSSTSALPRETDLPNEVEPVVPDALIQPPCKDHPQAPESIHDASFDSGPQVPYPPANDIVVTAVDQGEKQMLDEATSNFDTSLLTVDLPRSTSTLKIEADCGRVKKKAYGCSECSAKFYDLEGLKAHERVHKGQRPFLCSICDVASATKHHLIVHMRKHSGEKPFICDICKKAFADRSAYRRHKTIHETRKTFQCETCKKEFSDQSTYKRHQKEKHGSKDKKFQCKICEKEFNRKETFVSHVTHVHGVDIKKTTNTDPKATHHNQSQTKEKLKQYLSEDSVKKLAQNVKKWSSIKCPECGMVFYKRSAMEIHRRSHTGHKPFVCDVCDKRFGRSNNLKLHQRIHSGEKPYKCSEHDCGKAFSDISAFKRHVRTHSGVKPYKCDKCQRAFAQTGTMMNHKKHCNGPPSGATGACSAALPILVHKSNLSSPTTLGDEGLVGSKPAKRLFAMTSSNYPQETNNGQRQHEFLVNSITEDNSLSVMAGSEPPGLNTDTLDSVRASCL